MKTLAKLAAASILALAVVAPAFAAEENTLLERNSYSAHQVQQNSAKSHRAAEAFAFAPAGVTTYGGVDFSIESQR